MAQMHVRRGKTHSLQSRHTVEDKSFAACGRAILNRNILEISAGLQQINCAMCRNKLKLPAPIEIMAAAGFC